MELKNTWKVLKNMELQIGIESHLVFVNDIHNQKIELEISLLNELKTTNKVIRNISYVFNERKPY